MTTPNTILKKDKNTNELEPPRALMASKVEMAPCITDDPIFAKAIFDL